jgi:hypothetical protein
MTTPRANLLDNEGSRYKETAGINYLKTYQNDKENHESEKLTLIKSIFNPDMSAEELRNFLTK